MKDFILYTICINYHEFPLKKRGTDGDDIVLKNVNCYTDQASAITDLSNYVTAVNSYISSNKNIPSADISLFTLNKISDTAYAATSSNAPVVSINIMTNTLECMETTDLNTLLDNII